MFNSVPTILVSFLLVCGYAAKNTCALEVTPPPERLAQGPGIWVRPGGLPPGHNGAVLEHLLPPAAGKKPHIMMVLIDDWGWANAGWHRNYTAPGGEWVPATAEVQTPTMDALVRDGINLHRNYVYKYCSPTRSALQSGRNPYHVNPLNYDMSVANRSDPVSGFAGIPRNMTGLATKLAAAGYRTAMFGKWDAGMATPDHTPHGRGYHRALNYFHHSNDYWTMQVQDFLKCKVAGPMGGEAIPTDLWHKPPGAGCEGPARGLNNTVVDLAPVQGGRNVEPGPEGDHWWGGYEDSLFQQHVLDTVRSHDPEEPLFIFWAPHTVHQPLEVPQQFREKFSFIAPTDHPSGSRQAYASMVNFIDTAIANVTAALKAKGMWDDLLLVISADNGGPIYGNGTAGANNFPLKGGKMNNWEGGIRANGLVSGGFLPSSVRGTAFDGLVTAWDWYATFASLAGVDATDHRAKLAGLPPIDSNDLSPVLLGRSKVSPRREVPLGTEPRVSNVSSAPACSSYSRTPYYHDHRVRGDEIPLPPLLGNCTTVSGLIVDEGAAGLWKLLTGDLEQNVYLGPYFPNRTTNMISDDFHAQCANGCLYDLIADPLETTDLAAQMPHKVQELHAKLEAYEATAFNPLRGPEDYSSCVIANQHYGGFWGPFVDVPFFDEVRGSVDDVAGPLVGGVGADRAVLLRGGESVGWIQKHR